MASLTYTKATIFGAGQVGMTLMEQLVQQGVDVDTLTPVEALLLLKELQEGL